MKTSTVIPTLPDIFNIETLQILQDEFAYKTGVASIITHTDGSPITKPSNFSRLCMHVIRKTEKGLANCIKSDAIVGRANTKGPTIQPCLSGGLWDAGASITAGERHIANWLIGQVLNEEQDIRKMMEYAHEIGADQEEFSYALSFVTVMDQEKFVHISNALFLFAQQLSALATCRTADNHDFEGSRHLLMALVEQDYELRTLYEVWDNMVMFCKQGTLFRVFNAN